MRTWRLAVALLLVLSLLAAGCGGGEASGSGDGGNEGPGGASGTVVIDGSSTVGPLTDAVSEELAQENPDIEVNLGISGTGGGFERFCAGETDISNASRPIEPDEEKACEEAGVEYVEVQVGVDALTTVTSPDTDWVDCTTIAEIGRLFGPDNPAETWDGVNPEFPDEPVEVFAPGTDSGTYDFMVEDVLDEESSRQDYNASEDDNIIAQGVQGTRGSWGFFGFAYYDQNRGAIKALAVDGGDGCVEPSLETAQDESYPLIRPLFIYLKQESLDKDQVAEFARFYMETVNDVIEDVGYIPVPDDKFSREQEQVDQALAAAGGGS
ncbi:MAG: PstS family phosphate ABC transporter substrate-binding protein [Actinomycetota bacterium]|nr:PstS family phosphate ABC transporter substrate-binding protein [Actinomycetota bacterium]